MATRDVRQPRTACDVRPSGTVAVDAYVAELGVRDPVLGPQGPAAVVVAVQDHCVPAGAR